MVDIYKSNLGLMTAAQETKKNFSFSKKERLKSRSAIQALFTQNRTLRIYPFKLVWITNATETKTQVKVGVSVSKKSHRTAVARNFIKRRMRESYRLNKQLLFDSLKSENIDVSFMLIYLSKEIVPYKEFDQKIKLLLIRLGEKIKTK